nr:hypothetical protein [Methylocystis sp. Sn-Cys]
MFLLAQAAGPAEMCGDDSEGSPVVREEGSRLNRAESGGAGNVAIRRECRFGLDVRHDNALARAQSPATGGVIVRGNFGEEVQKFWIEPLLDGDGQNAAFRLQDLNIAHVRGEHFDCGGEHFLQPLLAVSGSPKPCADVAKALQRRNFAVILSSHAGHCFASLSAPRSRGILSHCNIGISLGPVA